MRRQAELEHTCAASHEPQFALRDVPQLSVAVSAPQVVRRRAQNAGSLSGMHEQTLLAPQTCDDGHVPQFTLRVAPQLSVALTVPQFFASRAQNCASVSRVQQALFEVQTCDVGHVPHWTVRRVPQLSLPVTLPQCFPSRAQKCALLSEMHDARNPPGSSVSAPGSVAGVEASESSGGVPGSTMGAAASRSSRRKASAGLAAPQPAAASAVPMQAIATSLDHALDDESRMATLETLFIWK
jgi:hypothetical protein